MKKSLFRSNQLYYHVNLDFEVNPISKEIDWIFIQIRISKCIRTYSVYLHALVMMDTHLHLLIQADLKNENFFVEELQLHLKGDSKIKTPEIEQTSESSPELASFCEPITNYAQYLNTYKYIYRNPVEAGLVSRVEHYPYSTLQSLLGLSSSRCDVIDHLGLIQSPIHQLNWLNNFEEVRFSSLSEMI